MGIKLYDYWRSSASYRVRIALNLKGVAYESVPVNLLAQEHLHAEHLMRNPQGFVPALAIDGLMLTQSLAILDYLEETRPAPPLLPTEPALRAKVRAIAQSVAIDIHPLCNMHVVAHVTALLGGDAPHKDAARKAWMQHFIRKGLVAAEALSHAFDQAQPFLAGDAPGLFECCLAPQMYNARRWEAKLAGLDRLLAIDEACAAIDAFKRAEPEAMQPA
jgi:maleylacetoacetate isomerase